VQGYEQGTLYIEVSDGKTRQLVWYGSASAVVNRKLREKQMPAGHRAHRRAQPGAHRRLTPRGPRASRCSGGRRCLDWNAFPANWASSTRMKRLVDFLKTTLLGGALVVLPAYLTVLLLLKALIQMQGLVTPVGALLPQGLGHPRVIAVLTLLIICFTVGAFVRTAVGRQLGRVVERSVLERLPGYTTLRSVAEQIGDMENARGFKPALVEIEDALAPAFIVEEHADGRFTVFLPSAPTPAAGTILIIDGARVHPVDVPLPTAFKVVTKWGTGAGQLLAAMRRA